MSRLLITLTIDIVLISEQNMKYNFNQLESIESKRKISKQSSSEN